MSPHPLRIVHVLRAPVGGLFRHVRDLAAAQSADGHQIGVICDSVAGDTLTTARLDAMRPHLALGLWQVPMTREIGLRDVKAHKAIVARLAALEAGIVHGHGAKGGAFARLAAHALRRRGVAIQAFYTPHGGSLHYSRGTLKGEVYMRLERALAPITDGVVFESRYSQSRFHAQVGAALKHERVIANGLLAEEFAPHVPAADALDVVYVGELRQLKGVGVLLQALARVAESRPSIRAMIVGDGPDAAAFRSQAAALGLGAAVTFPGARPAREAFDAGRLLVVPSLAESFPYIVLEAAAAGMPMLTTGVGGIPEIVEGSRQSLLAAGDDAALAQAILAALAGPEHAQSVAAELRELVARRFTVARMAQAIEVFYRSSR